MELKELIAFKTILEEGTFSKAAETLHYAQSTVTMQIQRLEKEIGFPLFDRAADMQLTDAGILFSQEIDNLLNHWYEVINYSKALEKDEIGTITIGAIEGLVVPNLPNVLAQFRRVKPNIKCHVKISNTEDLIGLLEEKKIDFFLGGKPQKSTLTFSELGARQISFIVSKKYRNAFPDVLSLENLYDFPLFIAESSCISYQKVASLLAVFPAPPSYFSISQVSSIPHFLHDMPSIGVVFSNMKLSSDVVEVPCEAKDAFIPIGLTQRKTDTQYLATTKQLLIQMVEKQFRLEK